MRHSPTIHILWEFTDAPWGGGNQFLKALKEALVAMGHYRDSPENADIIIFNSHQFQKQALRLKLRFPEKIFIHRIDGPLACSRDDDGARTDRQIFYCNSLIADGTVFQSQWSRMESLKNGLNPTVFETCIINAPDPRIFFASKPAGVTDNTARKISLIATSWSSNPRKGFDVYHHLDEHLDFSRYSMTFVGNPDKPFRNIAVIEPVPSKQLAELLRSHDIFISASKVESCSNSFLEGMHCGLPALARNNSSHPEILAGNGMLFDGPLDVVDTIDRLSANIESYRATLHVVSLREIAESYLEFAEQIKSSVKDRKYKPKRLSWAGHLLARLQLKRS